MRGPLLAVLLALTAPLALGQAAGSDKAAPAAQSATQNDTAKPSSKPGAHSDDFSKEGYVVERWFTRIREESDGSGTRERTAEIKILSEAGVKEFAVLEFPYTSSNEVMEFDYMRVRKPDGTIVKTPDYNIQDMPAEISRSAPLYSDVHEKHVAVKGLAVGDVLEYVARARVIKPQVPGQFWYEQTFIKESIARDESLEIDVPADKYVKIVSPEFKPEISEASGRRVYRWKHSNLAVKEKDPGEIPRLVPPNPDVQLTTFSSWEEVGRWYADLENDPLTVTPAIQAKAAELTKGLTTDDEKIRALYTFVSLKYHYVGLDFGIGRYQPHAADDVLDNGYGDCKDKHTLLASLLKASGIDAWAVLIHASRKLDPDVPSPAQFNHVITVVPEKGSYIWLDTTPEVAPYELILRSLRNKQALVVPTNQAPKLMTTPENPPKPQRQEFSMQGKLNSEGTFTGHAELSYDGDAEVLFRTAFRRLPESQWRDLVQRMSSSMNFGGEVSNVKVSSPDDIEKPFEISYDYERKSFAGWESHQTNAPLPPMGIESMKGVKERKPQEPIPLGALGQISYRSRVELPEGYAVDAPAPLKLVEPYADYDSHTAVEKGVMTTTRVLTIKKTEIQLNEWEDFRRFGELVYDDEYNLMKIEKSVPPLPQRNPAKEADENKSSEPDKKQEADTIDLASLFQEGADAIQRGDFQKAQEMNERIIARDPNYKGAHLNLGVALASRRMITDALDEFRKEEKVSPQDPRAYQIVATYLTQMMRSDEAMEEWRKLLKVDPENRTAATTLGGMLYQAEKYTDAVQILEPAVKKAPDSRGLQFLLGESYLKTGQNEKAVTSFHQAIDQKADDAMMLNNVAYALSESKASLDLAEQYAEKAISLLEKQSQEAGSSSTIGTGLEATYQLSLTWDTLGWIYFQQGDAKRAEALVRPAWLLGEHEVVAEHLAEIYEREGKTQQAARQYEQALAVSSNPIVFMGPSPLAPTQGLQEENKIRARYKKLTGKEPALTEIRRLPNGEWTKTPAEQLRQTRQVKLANEGKLSGSGQFLLTFKPGKVVSAEITSGSDDLERLADKLKSAHYPIEFPPDSAATLVLRVDVNCHPSEACVGSMVNPVPGPNAAASTEY